MRRIVLALMSTVAAVVVLFGYRTSTAHPAAASTPVAAAPADTSGTTSTTPAVPVPSTSATTATKTATATVTATTKTVTGQTEQTRWGPVQVQLTVANGKVTAVNVLQQPSGNPRDAEINAQALPILTQETVKAQSAHIDAVSGATVTSDGYISSLQSALDEAGL